jgi:glycosyltransferase involved in cell wall biosynthesis
MRVCIVAEHASFRFGGEAALPAQYFSRLRRRGVEAWLVVHERTRRELESRFPSDRDRLRFIEDRRLHRLLFRLSHFLPRRISESTLGLLSQLLTQYLQRRIVRELIAQESIDIVHQPIPVSPRFPSLMWGFGVPVIIGPMNGGMEYPPGFRHAESFFSRAAIRFGRRLSNAVNSMLPGKKFASFLLAANGRTRLALPSCAQGRIVEMPENGVDLETWSAEALQPPSPQDRTDLFRFVFIGRLVDWKSVDVAIEALREAPEAELEIIGDGPMRTAWQNLSEQFGVAHRVTFSGWRPQEACAPRLRSAVALLLPSIYECGGAVVLEAMAAGVPVIATKWGGPADYLDSDCGLLVEPLSRKALVTGFGKAMQQLIAQPELGKQMGQQGRERVARYFDWERKTERILDIYRAAIGSTAERPDELAKNGPHPESILRGGAI